MRLGSVISCTIIYHDDEDTTEWMAGTGELKNEDSIWLFRLFYDRPPLAFPLFEFAIYYAGL